MMRRIAHVAVRLALLGALVGSPIVASAQPAAPAGQATADARQRRDKIKQRIRALRAYTLTEELELDEATAGKLFPALARYDDEFDRLLQARADLQRRLTAADTTADTKAIDKLIDEAAVNQRAIWDTEVRRLDHLRKILTAKQVAKLLVVLPALERKLQSELRKVAGKAPAADSKKAPATRGSADDGVPGPTDVIDPFGPGKDPKRERIRDNTQLVDPFADDPPAKKRPSGTKATRADGVCDPFVSAHGCK